MGVCFCFFSATTRLLYTYFKSKVAIVLPPACVAPKDPRFHHISGHGKAILKAKQPRKENAAVHSPRNRTGHAHLAVLAHRHREHGLAFTHVTHCDLVLVLELRDVAHDIGRKLGGVLWRSNIAFVADSASRVVAQRPAEQLVVGENSIKHELCGLVESTCKIHALLAGYIGSGGQTGAGTITDGPDVVGTLQMDTCERPAVRKPTQPSAGAGARYVPSRASVCRHPVHRRNSSEAPQCGDPNS